MKRTTRRTSIVVGVVLTLILAYLIPTGMLAYFYATYLEGNWSKSNPRTKDELEKHLHLYSLHQIDPLTSMWGRHYTLKENERMMQYLILWSAPLDVVYDKNNNIKGIYTSYE